MEFPPFPAFQMEPTTFTCARRTEDKELWGISNQIIFDRLTVCSFGEITSSLKIWNPNFSTTGADLGGQKTSMSLILPLQAAEQTS